MRATVKKLEKTLPTDVKLELIYTLANHIRDSYEASVDALVLGAVLAIITIFIFLRDWRATLIAAVALPLSAIPTFAVLRLLGYTLNSMTLLALSLVVGILVDDAIVEIENIERHVGMGKTAYQAALDASAEIGLAVVATTMTIVSVFAPVAFIYGVLVLLFANFLHPITIMAALPLSLGGALLGLLVGQKSLGLYALIGVVLLMGIVTKNSILLVDYAIMNQKEGEPMYEATLDSGVARLRPILMTTIAMIAGMVPIALGIGAGSQVRSPMAMAVIGGLMTSTLLTLVVIPVVYTYMDGLQVWIFNLVRGKKKREGRSKFSG